MRSGGRMPASRRGRPARRNSYVSTAARLLRLGPQTTGLLVSQRYGFEASQAHDLLILAARRKTHHCVEGGRGIGAQLERHTDPCDPRPARELSISMAFSTPTRTPRALDAVRLSFHAASGRLRETACPLASMPLYLSISESTRPSRKPSGRASANAYCLTPIAGSRRGRFSCRCSGKPSSEAVCNPCGRGGGGALAKSAARRDLAVETWSAAPSACRLCSRPPALTWTAHPSAHLRCDRCRKAMLFIEPDGAALWH